MNFKTMGNRSLWLMLLPFFCLPLPLVAKSPHKIIIGGPIRYGGFNLVDSAKDIETSISYDEKQLNNNLGKLIFVSYYYTRFGIGLRWMTYRLEGLNDQFEQTLALEYSFITLAACFFEGTYLHPDIDSRFGLLIGKGNSRFELDTVSVQSMDQVTSSSAAANLFELFFESTLKNDLGYRLGYFSVNAEHSGVHNGYKTDASTKPNIYLTVIWQFR